MSILLIPVAPLFQTKSRLRDYFSTDQLKELTIALVKDLGKTLLEVDCFDNKLLYCNSLEILDLGKDYDLIGIKEEITTPPKSFDEIINDLNHIAINEYKATMTLISFIDLVLISPINYYELFTLMESNQLTICPAIHSAGISILGRNPPEILPSYFSDPNIPSLLALLHNASKNQINKIAIYDSFRAGFDIDILQDLILAYEYLKIFDFKEKEIFKFLKTNLKFSIKKLNPNNNRNFKISEIE
jgi:2-phospho-L-lactate guanylyltransferase (CobY/MobA/RfbA family)